MPYQSVKDIAATLRSIQARGFVGTHRTGDTGVGKTLEDLLGIVENNDDEADFRLPSGRRIELKSRRAGGSNPITLFTKEPPTHERRYWNDNLINHAGYADGDRQSLYTTLAVDAPNPQGLSLSLSDTHVIVEHDELGRCARYGRSQLAATFESKFPEVILVTAHANGTGASEQFWYQEATHLTGFDEIQFFRLLKQGDITLDTRIHRKADGTLRNHGTAWRVTETALPDLFAQSTDLLTATPDEPVERLGQQLISQYI